MSEFVFKRDDSAAMTAGIGGMTTGVYKCKVDAVVFNPDSKGNPRVDIYFEDANGKRAIVFGMCIAEKWLTGSDNSDYKKWQEFAAVCGMTTGAMAQQNVKVSKDKTEPKNVFTECTGKMVNVALQETFDVYNGKETNDKSVYRTFFESGHSLAEKQTNTDAKQIEAVKSKLTPYETKAYKAFKAGGSSAEMPEENSQDAGNSTADDLI